MSQIGHSTLRYSEPKRGALWRDKIGGIMLGRLTRHSDEARPRLIRDSTDENRSVECGTCY